MPELTNQQISYNHKYEMEIAYNQLRKHTWLALLLMVFFGWIGAHRFYLGHAKKGFYIIAGMALTLYVLYFGLHDARPWKNIGIAYAVFLFIGYRRVVRDTKIENEHLHAFLREKYGL